MVRNSEFKEHISGYLKDT